MPVVWTIKGEAGKSVDATEHTLPLLQAEGAEVYFGSLEDDRLTWSIWLRAMTEAATIVPDLGQKITLYRNGVRYFTGNVTGRRTRLDGNRATMDITVDGPWWWLKNMMLSTEQADQSGATSERVAYVFPTGSVKNHLQGLATRAIAMGAPISIGSIANCFNIPRLSLRNISFAEAFSELMRWVADGILYFDYTGSDATAPALCMQRRPAAAAVTITPANGTVPSISVGPRLDLKIEELHVTYAKRSTVSNKRLTVWDAYSAGAVTSSLPKRQIVVFSGPEMDTWLPQDFTDSVVVRSAVRAGAEGTIIAQKEDRLRAAGAGDFGVGAFTDPVFLGGSFTLPALATTWTDSDGKPLPAGYNYWLKTGEVRDWWTKDGIENIDARLAATIYSVELSPSPTPGGWTPTPPLWFKTIGGQQYSYLVAGDSGARTKVVYAATVSVPVTVTKKLWSSDTTLIRSEDYAFVNPPADLATNLLATQNWLPFEGTVVQVFDDIPASHYLGCVLNISAVTDELATMRALIAGQSISLRTGQVTYTLGAPARLSFRDLVNRFRQSGADNIVWLVNPSSGNAGDNPPPAPGLEVPNPPNNAVLNEDSSYELDEDGSIAIDET